MKKILIIICLLLLVVGCTKTNENQKIELNYNFETVDNLKDGNNKKVKVIILLGQSNATGVGIVDYLKQNVTQEEFNEYENGYNNILINYLLDNGVNTSGGDFVKTDLSCGATTGYFGPEVGIAKTLSDKYPDEEIFILKYTMSGTSLTNQWMFKYERSWIYNHCIAYLKYCLSALQTANYQPNIEAICFMQGESDTFKKGIKRYYKTEMNFIKYLRNDLDEFNDSGIYFIDAGISDSPYFSPGYKKINEAKIKVSKKSNLNIYFPTIERGLTTAYEPYDNPDLAHYDSLSTLNLGIMFAEEIIKIFEN